MRPGSTEDRAAGEEHTRLSSEADAAFAAYLVVWRLGNARDTARAWSAYKSAADARDAAWRAFAGDPA